MDNPRLHRYAVLVAVCTFLLFINGPVVSTNEYRPLYSLGQSHAWLGAVVTILVTALVFWLSRLKVSARLRQMAWTALGASIVLDLVVFESSPLPAPLRIAHTLLGQLFFSTTVVIVIFTSKNWSRSTTPIEHARPLRIRATTTVALVLLQVSLGAAFRHGAIGALPHILGALVLAVFLGPAIAMILRTERREVRSAAIALTMTACLQILVGFALLTMESFDDIDPLVVIIVTTAHVALGSLTLAAAIATAIQIKKPAT